ncbi:hypothetical protein [Companilactobacillus alimentarius]|uniref:Uncharacterized protein n=1 Tax=Companilactobacillus alimentarius DSM 20249 TaxID=1423720 RepID=A0A2K9HJS8_9LACO|nr:hypothetical protein [Companilactobacillus alimentarius]AUI71967.1 hypothetical protein LA20249_07160 [Companilactobacillus alimentarius DSM 20249]KRK77914.1 hypothetical protein FC67_GL001246 [Companilactobacillus alimentarius DSM 20249]GEO45281.1 hypothetical protein LAL01_15130 [Companilactobacillus alimentarius]
MLGVFFVIGSIASLILEKYVLANNSHVWLGAIVPVLSIIFIVWQMLNDSMKFNTINVLLAVAYVSLNFIFWGQGNDLYHQRVVHKVYKSSDLQ